MKPRHRPLLLLSVALAALALAGCGGGSDETTEATPTTEEAQALTKAELIEQGDAICAEVNAAVGALGAEAAEAAVPDTIEKSANLYIGMIERLQDLGTPVEDDGGYAKFMEAAEVFAKVEGEVKLATEREDTAALGLAATEAAPALEEFRSQAAVYGFEECSEEARALSPAGGEGAEEFEGEEEGGVEAEPEAIEPEAEEAPEEAPETGGAGGGTEPEAGGGESGGGSESGGVGPG